MLTPKNYEPIKFSAGDTLTFQRYLFKYLPSAGWQLVYEIRGQGLAIEFTSTAIGNNHVLTVPASTTVAWPPGTCEMEGYAVNSGTSERERIYINNLEILPNLQTPNPAIVVTTHAQRMITLIEAVQEGKATHDLLESDVEGTRIRRLSPKDLRDEYNYWKQIRLNEIRKANSAAGRSNGRNRFAVFTDPNGVSIGQFGALPPIFPGEQL